MTKLEKHCGKRRTLFCCHYVEKKLSTGEATESMFIRERAKIEGTIIETW